jgi:dolichol-phosphate mannosyltransferase
MNGSLTILIPVYNEEDCIQPLYTAMNTFLDQTTLSTNVMFIDDGSEDRSVEMIENVSNNDDRYSLLSLKKNYGLSTALKAGIDKCRSTFIGYMDSDLQTHPRDFQKLIDFIPEFDLVTGYRLERKDNGIKKLSSVLANSFRRWLLNDTIIDTGCPLKIIRTEIARQLPFFNGMHRFIPNMVILLGGRVKQVPISHYRRYAGKAKYTLANRMIGPIIDIVVFRWMQRNFIRYATKING